MTEEPLVIYRDGKLWRNEFGVYEPTDRFQVVMLREHFLQRTRESGTESPVSATYANQCNEALIAHEKQRETASE